MPFMENLHAPTVPSGPSTMPNGIASQNNMLSLSQLETKKDNLEAELRALGSVLDFHGVDMNTRLITPDGFPRADLDVAQIRTTRSRIIHLRNDYKGLMNIIEKRIHEHFANLAHSGQDNSGHESSSNDVAIRSSASPSTITTIPLSTEPSFAKVNSVEAGSPAATAGLRPGDEIRKFGYVNYANHDGLKGVGECVQGNIGRDVLVKISRSISNQRQDLQLVLQPRRDWGGRGLLGCHILPL